MRRFRNGLGWVLAGLLLLVAGPGTQAAPLRVGVLDSPPELFLQSDGQVGGLLGELLRAMAERESWTLEAHACRWSTCLQLLRAGALDLLPNVTYTPERARSLAFHATPVLFRSTLLYARQGAPLHALADLRGKTIAVLADSAQYHALKGLLAQHHFKARLIATPLLETGFERVQKGEADAAAAHPLFGDRRASAYGLVATPITFLTEAIYYAAPAGQQAAVLSRIDHYLSRWKETPDSPYFQALARWGHPAASGPVTAVSSDHDIVRYGLATGLLLLAGLVLAGWQRRRRAAVRADSPAREPHRPPPDPHGDGLRDGVTGLPNGQLLMTHIQQTLEAVGATGVMGAILLVDIANFRSLSDAQGGGPAATVLLQRLAARLSTTMHAGDTVFRAGDGTVFAVLLTGLGKTVETTAGQVMQRAERIRAAFRSEPILISGQACGWRLDLGVRLIDQAGLGARDLLRQAEVALQQAARAGNDRVAFFDPELQRRLEFRWRLTQDLAAAIQRGRLCLHVQPQFTRDGQVAGAELLARWDHPAHGPIAPDFFIALARERGLLRALSDAIFAQGCAIVQALDAAGARYPVSLNIDAATLADPDFVTTVRDGLAIRDLKGDRFIFEITEDIIIRDSPATVRHMHALNACGIRFSIDDFGTGYSNLAYLRTLPLHELKIDRSLVGGLPGQREDVAVVQLILGLARRLGLRTVAEGIEHPEQAAFLFRHHCSAIQGYLAAPPMPLADWLETGPTRPRPIEMGQNAPDQAAGKP